jgi:hypothetical protein
MTGYGLASYDAVHAASAIAAGAKAIVTLDTGFALLPAGHRQEQERRWSNSRATECWTPFRNRWSNRIKCSASAAPKAFDGEVLLGQRSLLRRVRQCHIRVREDLCEVVLPDLDRGGPELAQQRVGRLAGERAHVEGVQLCPTGPE